MTKFSVVSTRLGKWKIEHLLLMHTPESKLVFGLNPTPPAVLRSIVNRDATPGQALLDAKAELERINAEYFEGSMPITAGKSLLNKIVRSAKCGNQISTRQIEASMAAAAGKILNGDRS